MIKKFDADKIYFTSDTHFSHSKIIGFCNRPFEDVEQMNETMIERWNNVVGENDIVFHLGDFCLGGSTEWNRILDRLNGKIYLVLGNHDSKNLRPSVESRFAGIEWGMCIKVEDYTIYLNHYPFLCFDGGYQENVWQLFGHVHTRVDSTGLDAERLQHLYPTQLDVGVDNNDFTPLSFAEVKAKLLAQQAEK